MSKKIFFVIGLFCFLAPLTCLCQESINIITVYTSPAGIYDQLLATSFSTWTLGVGDTNGDLRFDINDAPDPGARRGQIWTTGRVGIGTNAPGALLHASGRSNGIIAVIGSGPASSDVQLIIREDVANNRIELQAQTGGGAPIPLVLNPGGGKVGFGTYDLTKKLRVAQDVEVSGVVQFKSPDIPTTTTACFTREAGRIAIRADGFFVGCDGSKWRTISY